MRKICFLGCGNMVSSLLEVCRGVDSNFQFSFFTPSKEKARKLSGEHQGVFLESLSDIDTHDIFVFGFKPQQYLEAVKQYSTILPSKIEIWSLLAGTSLESIESDFPEAAVFRVMPNVCSSVGEGISLYTHSLNAETKYFLDFFSKSFLI